jgi:glycosyltransferase involved in cell wall biosynthesis
MKIKRIGSIYFKFLLIIIIIFFFKFNNFFLKFFFSYTYEIINIKKYFRLCNSGILINRNKYKLNKFPKVSIIAPVYNREKFILRFLRSVQNQKFNNIEIIFIDDYSKDKSVEIIKKNQVKDERIILINNKKNKGTLISRTIGALKSRGEYLIFPDPDDIISNNIINFCYNFIKTHNYEMLRFNLFIGHHIFLKNIVYGLENKIINQPELSTFLFYGKGRLLQIDFNVSNKFIKRKAFIRALNSVNEYYLNQYMNTAEDGLMNYILYRSAKSLFFIKKIGYYYIKNKESITNANFTDKKLKSFFHNLKLIFEYSKNNKYEKDMANAYIYKFISPYKDNELKQFISNDCDFYTKIIKLYLNCEFISVRNKIKLTKIKC